MAYYLVAPVIVVRSSAHAFTYYSEEKIPVGSIVRIPIGKKKTTGLVIGKVDQKPSFPTKPIEEVLVPQALPREIIKLAEWLSGYYATHLAITLQTILPTGLHKKRRVSQKTINHPIRNRTQIILNDYQKRALSTIQSSIQKTILLHGVTGSGKTQVYIEAVKTAVGKGKSCIVLVPEISLTPQLVAEFANHFSNLIVTHSKMTEAERHKAWLKTVENAQNPTIIIGPRSALFMPVQDVGLIIIDECHEPSYKQDQSPRYSALRAASMLAQFHGDAKVILGSATPSVADYYLAKSTGSPIIVMDKPISKLEPVTPHVIDFKNRAEFSKHRFLSNTLISHIHKTLETGNQALIFHNRRGTAPTTLCEHCGWLAECSACFLPLTLHADTHSLRCHLCNFQTNIPPNCPTCKEPTIVFKGIGTKLIETEITKIFPKAKIARFDADTTDKETVRHRYQELYDGEIDILIGTQMLAKGLDLPKLQTVGVIQADSGLMLPDFTSEERTFQLLYQVMGRVGRSNIPGEVIVQSYQPEHPIIKSALARNYMRFYEAEIEKRKKAHFPPFSFLLKLTCSYKTEASAISASQKIAQALRKAHHLEVLGPTPSFYERLGGSYRWQIVIKAKKRAHLIEVIQKLPPHWQADIDPSSLL